MAKRSVRAYVELASGLGEMTRARAVEAAQELVTLAGAKGSSGKVAKQVEKLAGDLLGAAEQNRAHVVGLVQREVESAVARVDVTRLLTEVQALGATVAGLAAQVDELARSAGGRAGRAPRAGLAEVTEPVLASPPATSSAAPARKAPARKAPARKAPARRAPAKKSAAKTSAAKKSAAKTSTAPRTAATQVAKKSAAKKSTAKKSAAKTSTAKRSPVSQRIGGTSGVQRPPATTSAAKKGTTKKAGA
jgi:cobalamin biosynthesis Mg chelatase CobN